MTTPDVDPEEIVRRADRLHRIDFTRADARCTCHAWTVPVPYNAVMAHAAHERHRAAEIVAALTRAGVIQPADLTAPAPKKEQPASDEKWPEVPTIPGAES